MPRPSGIVTIPNLVTLGQTVWAKEQGQKTWQHWGPAAWGMGARLTPRNTPHTHARVTMPNFIVQI